MKRKERGREKGRGEKRRGKKGKRTKKRMTGDNVGEALRKRGRENKGIEL